MSNVAVKKIGIYKMGEQTTSGLNPIYNHLLSLIEECRQKDAPAYMVDGINKAIQLIEVPIMCHKKGQCMRFQCMILSFKTVNNFIL